MRLDGEKHDGAKLFLYLAYTKSYSRKYIGMQKLCVTSFDLENIGSRSQNFMKESSPMWSSYPPNFVFLASPGAEISEGGRMSPPPTD